MSIRSGKILVWSLAVLVPLVCVAGGEAAYNVAIGRGLRLVEKDGFTLRLLVAGAPLLLLAFLMSTARVETLAQRPWIRTAIAGATVTVAIWAWCYSASYADARGRRTDAVGADQGVGLLMIFSPLVVVIVMVITMHGSRRAGRREP